MRHLSEEDLQLLITLDDPGNAQEESTFIFHVQIEKLAYQFWEERGRPLGSSEEDWFRAERELRHHFGLSFSYPLDSPMAFPFSSFMMGPITQ